MTLMQSFELVLFMALLLMVSMHALSASGHFPREHRSKNLASASGSMILFGTIGVALACMALGVFFVQAKVPWYAAIIGGGTVVLIAPLLLQMFSDRFVDGRVSLLAFSFAAGCLACAMALLH